MIVTQGTWASRCYRQWRLLHESTSLGQLFVGTSTHVEKLHINLWTANV